MSAPLPSPVLNKIRFDTSDLRLTHELKERVDAHFTARGLSRHADARMAAKSVFFFGSVVAVLALLVTGVVPAVGALLLCLLLGVLNAGVGFNIGHDAIHGAYSDKPWLNALLSRSFDFVGASSFTWSTAHNFVHHTYTNVPGVDHDLEPGPFMLFYERERPGWIYRFQHVYSWILYAFASLIWLYKKDFQQIFAPDPRSGKRAPTSKIVDMIAWKAFHVGLYVGLPMLVSGYAWWQVLLGYLAIHAATGITIAAVFQLAHVVEKTAFPRANEQLRIEDSFMVHQLKTTANFAPGSWLANFFCGGLNHQVEHHLFPKICHIHYPEIAPIVREVARKYGVPYHEYPSFPAAFVSHLRTMKRFGHPAVVAPVVDVTEAVPAE
jgi:linoleoyl-CoA desaturase